MRLRCDMLRKPQSGVSLIEVLVAIMIMAFGLLGLAALQSHIHRLELESYQRAQAVVLMNDMLSRINTNRANASSYVLTGTIGTGDAQPTNCNSLMTTVARDLCEWSNLLKGAAEKSDNNPIGAMANAIGCITAFSSTTKSYGFCQTGYQIDVVWLATQPTSAPSSTCGANLFGAANEAYRRAISTRIGTGIVAC